MMSNILKGISCAKTGEKIEPDATSDFSFILGDLNARFASTYTKHIARVEESKDLIPDMDELYKAYTQEGKYPFYEEMKINFMPTYKRDSDNNENYVNKKDQCPSFTDRIPFKNNTQV